MVEVIRFRGNPILRPESDKPFKSFAAFNAAALKLKDKVYILYRAQAEDLTSTIGLAVSSDGLTVEEELPHPVYVPRERFEKRIYGRPGPVGCEDPRVTVIGDTIYMVYVAVSDAYDYVRVAITHISVEDFLARKWDRWAKPKAISPPGVWDKDAALFERRIQGKYVFLHRFFPNIWIDFVDDLSFDGYWIRGTEFFRVRPDRWDSDRVGIAGPPIEVSEGWVLIYHAKSAIDGAYRLGAALLDKEDPTTVLARLPYPILEPKEWYEVEDIPVVFSNGHVVMDGKLYLYYGASDKYLAVAVVDLDDLVGDLLKHIE